MQQKDREAEMEAVAELDLLMLSNFKTWQGKIFFEWIGST